MRRLTIGRKSRKSLYPEIRIRGLWLWELGWGAGDKVEIYEDRKEILLRRISFEDPNPRQLPLPHITENTKRR